METVNSFQDELTNIAMEIEYAVKSVKKIAEDKIKVVTQEGYSYNVSLSTEGFYVMQSTPPNGDLNDLHENVDGKTFETIYAFLDKVSPAYRLSFMQSLHKKMAEI